MIPRGLEIALDHGLRVFPVRIGEKRPAAAHGCKDATSDRGRIAEWAREMPECNWGAAMGADIFALDIDHKNGVDGGAALVAMIEQHGDLPPHLVSHTPNSGSHHLFRGAGVRNSASKIAPGVDVRGEGGYIVIPPSRLAKGAYKWVKEDAPIPDAPDWLWEWVLAEVASVARKDATVTEGSRNSSLTEHLGRMRALGMTDDELLHEALRYNAERCSPPLPLPEVQSVLRSAFGWRRQFAMSDTGNARRWRLGVGADALYVASDGDWYTWGGHRWVRDAEGLRCVGQLKDSVITALGTEVPERDTPAEQQALARWLISSQNTKRLEAALANARSEPGVAVDRGQLDAQQHLVGVANGVIDLGTMQFRDGRREDLVTLSMGAAFEPGADAPLFRGFLSEQVSEPVATYLQQLVGLTLLGNTLRLLLFIYGPTATGKSVFLEVVKGLFGDYGRAASSDLLMAKALRAKHGPTEALARLAGARLVTVNETGATDAFDEATIKDLTGADTVSARMLYRGSFDFRPMFTIWIRGNHKPRFSGSDAAMLERIRLVPFNRQRAAGERDPHLVQKITRTELPGVLNWALAGAEVVRSTGRIETPSEVETATREYAQEMDLLGLWIGEECALGAERRCTASAAYQRFRTWCGEQGIHHPWTAQAFGRAMSERFPKRRIGDAWNYFGVEVVAHGRM